MIHRIHWHKMKKNLILFNFVLCLFLIFSNIFLYYIYMRDSYNETLQLSYSGAISQVEKSYETLISHAENVIKETVAYDFKFLQIAENPGNNAVGQMEMVKALEQILSRSNFLCEVSFWPSGGDTVYMAGTTHNGIEKTKNFNEIPLFQERENDTIQTSLDLQKQNEKAFLTQSIKVYINNIFYGILCGKIDIEAVSQYVLDKEITMEGHNEIYILDKKGQVIYPYNKIFEPNKKNFLYAETASNILDWRFVLQTPKTKFPFLNRNNSVYLFISLLLLGTSIGATMLVIGYLTRPLQMVSEHYARDFWNRILTGGIAIDQEAFAEMRRQAFVLEKTNYVVLVTEKVKPQERSDIRVACMGKDQYAVILRKPEASEEICRELLKEEPGAWIGVSERKNHVTSLQAAFIEASEALKYKFCANHHVIEWERIANAKPFQYDHELETKLVNHVITGDKEGAMQCLEQIFDAMHSSMIEDNLVVSVVYRLENAILRGANFLSLPFPEETHLPAEKLRSELKNFVESVCDAVNELNNTGQSSVWEQVLFEIERNFTQADFCLDYLAESLGMKKAYLSKCIKENTGDSFPEFINKKRIALAKLLLLDTEESVEAISEQLGFNYSYYFIRIFKKYEGITPKMFRDAHQE
ncbi:helix-turn-helix domain-containing protein [Ructibacterium gallinarum]|uniref:AraC family transcriptional regulator n=1 Tax=Ructibacterium gallinarum TaxID=2779355 RepID=A0A9D5M5J4_9FIRM|nr:helix-turn-helix domain-containing protein [Ructibacterium gallinarum]MBE5041099.1 AraC family transcriptional regulator [Ructibacterium gallinarum]